MGDAPVMTIMPNSIMTVKGTPKVATSFFLTALAILPVDSSRQPGSSVRRERKPAGPESLLVHAELQQAHAAEAGINRVRQPVPHVVNPPELQ